HTGGDVGIAEELVAVPVVDGNVGAEFLRSGVSALHEAVAVTDNGGHSLAAEEAELGEAVLNGGVTGQVTGLLFFEGDAVDVGGDLLGADIAGGDVNADDVDVGVFLSLPGDGGTVQVADADDGVVAIVDRVADQGLAVFVRRIVRRQIVVDFHAVGLTVSLDGFPAALVEALIVNGADVAALGDTGDGGSLNGAGLAGRAGGGGLAGSGGRFAAGGATGSQRKRHGRSHRDRQNLFHVVLSL